MASCSQIREYVRSRTLYENHYEVAFFDLIGPASLPNLDDVTTFITNSNVVHPGKGMIAAFTFNSVFRNDPRNQREKAKVEKVLETDLWFEKNAIRAYDEQIASALVINSLQKKHKKWRRMIVIHSETYQAQQDSTPMFFIVMHLEKFA